MSRDPNASSVQDLRDRSLVHPPVIVGAGPIGLSAALELARHGVRGVLLERNRTTTHHPKTRNTNTRTMEIIRGWGQQLRKELLAVDLGSEWKTSIQFMRSLAGEELGKLNTSGFVGPGADVSPEAPILSSQDVVEPILLRAVQHSGMTDVRFGHELLAFRHESDEDGPHVVIEVCERDTGRHYSLSASALVGADGGASVIREQLEIPLDGPRGFGRFINVHFRADLEHMIPNRRAVLLYVANDKARGLLAALDGKGRWIGQMVVPESEWDPALYPKERCTAWLREAVGIPDLNPEILSVGKWLMNASVARRFVEGRVVLVGDAAHQLPPTGGLGANTGIQGLHNVIWKLVLVLRGVAGPGLLQTYETERWPISRRTADQSYDNQMKVRRLHAAIMGDPTSDMTVEQALGQLSRFGNHIGLELGSAYKSPAVVPDGSSPPQVQDSYTDYVPTGRPGHRAPHFWVRRDGERLSSIDLFGPHFTVLAGKTGADWLNPARAAADEFGVDLKAYLVGTEGALVDEQGVFLKYYGLEPNGAVLVRPDGFIAFRAVRYEPSGREQLYAALAQILHTGELASEQSRIAQQA